MENCGRACRSVHGSCSCNQPWPIASRNSRKPCPRSRPCRGSCRFAVIAKRSATTAITGTGSKATSPVTPTSSSATVSAPSAAPSGRRISTCERTSSQRRFAPDTSRQQSNRQNEKPDHHSASSDKFPPEIPSGRGGGVSCRLRHGRFLIQRDRRRALRRGGGGTGGDRGRLFENRIPVRRQQQVLAGSRVLCFLRAVTDKQRAGFLDRPFVETPAGERGQRATTSEDGEGGWVGRRYWLPVQKQVDEKSLRRIIAR